MSRSVRAIYQSPYSRYQASQLTQESNFAISVVEDLKVYWNSGTNYTNSLYDIGAAITRTGVHLQLSNSFELWRINSVTIKFQLKTFSGDVLNLYEDVDITQYIDFYTTVRRGKKTDHSLEELESNSSFEQVTWPANGMGPCPPLKRTIHNSSLRFASTKMTAPFPFIIYGLRVQGLNHFMANQIYQTPFIISMQIQAKCSYKGVRLDKSNVLTSINPNVVNNVTTTTWFIPTLSSMLLTRGSFGPDPDEQIDLMKQPWHYTAVMKNIACSPGQTMICIRPYTLMPNIYGIYSARIPATSAGRNFTVGPEVYYCIAPNIFNDTNPTVTIYLYSENNKLFASTLVGNNSLTNSLSFRLHMDLVKLNDLLINE